MYTVQKLTGNCYIDRDGRFLANEIEREISRHRTLDAAVRKLDSMLPPNSRRELAIHDDARVVNHDEIALARERNLKRDQH